MRPRKSGVRISIRVCRRELARLLDAGDEVRRAAVAQVVAVDAGDDDVLQLQRRDRLGQVHRLVGVERIGPAVADVAERAAPRALVAHDHEGRRALAEALADVRARRFLAHRVQLVLAQDLLDLVEAGAAATPALTRIQSGFFSTSPPARSDRDARGLGLGLLLVRRVVGRREGGVIAGSGGRRACRRGCRPRRPTQRERRL